MPTPPGAVHINVMRGRRKGGATASPAPAPPAASLSAHADAFLEHLAARALSPASIEFTRWSLRGFLECVRKDESLNSGGMAVIGMDSMPR